jgi:hypothetical protein
MLQRRKAIYEVVSLTYGGGGFYFMEPGQYRITAVYRAGGVQLVSNTLFVWVRYPTRTIEDLIVPTFDSAVGEYLSVWGSQDLEDRVTGLTERLLSPRLKRQHSLDVEIERCRIMKELRVSRRSFAVDSSGARIKYRIVQPNLTARTLGRAAEVLGLDRVRRRFTLGKDASRVNVATIRYAHLAASLARMLNKDDDPAAAADIFASIEGFNRRRDVQAGRNKVPSQALDEWKKFAFGETEGKPKEGAAK